MRKLFSIPVYAVLSVMILVSCKKEQTPEAIPTGSISGKIVAANHTSAIKNAVVFTTYQGKVYLTHSDVTGAFLLEAPAGNRHLTIQTGDGSMFRTEMDVVVTEGQTTAVAADAVSLDQVATLAYISGTYDAIENILGVLGYTATPITWSMLNSISYISAYDAIFIDCTSASNMISVNSTTDAVLGTYVANGGSLYISDWAVKALVGTHGNVNDPCSIQRAGGFIADSLLCVRKSGATMNILNAPIVSTSLQAYLNKTNIDNILYDLPEWEKINYLDQNFWETLVTDPGGNPLLIRTNTYSNPTRGTVSIGSVANSGYSPVCITLAGGEHVTLSVKNSDVQSLVTEGASAGACNNLEGSGWIYYTTFHDAPGGQISQSPDVLNILEYVILNL